MLARRQAWTLAGDEVARGLDDTALARVEFLLGRRRAHDQAARHVGRALIEPRGRRVVRQPAGPDQRDAQVFAGEEFPDRLPECAHAAERRPRVGGAIDEYRQCRVAGERAGELEERDGDAVIDLHLVGDGNVEIARLQVAHARERSVARHAQRATFQVPILVLSAAVPMQKAGINS